MWRPLLLWLVTLAGLTVGAVLVVRYRRSQVAKATAAAGNRGDVAPPLGYYHDVIDSPIRFRDEE